jgi:hypothetical protein
MKIRFLRIFVMLPFCLAFFSYAAISQPVDFSNCPNCEQKDIVLHSETVNKFQGIRGHNPFRPSTYGLIGSHKYSGTGWVVLNPFFGLNWFPIRREKQMLTGTFIEFGVANYGDESDWNIQILPDPPFEELITDALPYQKDNWYASGDWKTSPDGRFLIEAEITPDERRYGNPWFSNETEKSPLLNKKLTVYGPFVREEAHGNHPEIHPAEQIWWREPNDQHIVLLVIDDSNRFDDFGDFNGDRVTLTPPNPWVAEQGQRATLSYAFEINPSSGGAYIAIQAIDDQDFFTGEEFADAGTGTKHTIRYKGNIVLTVQEAEETDKIIGVKFSNVCFNTAKGTLQGFVDISTAIGNGSGREGFVALQFNKQDVGLNARPALFAGDILNTWKNFGPYDDKIAFSQIFKGNTYGTGMVHGILDFNGNGKSDLFAKRGDQWMVLYDGKGSWQELGSSGFPIEALRFGDIDGDKKTDILRDGPNDKIVVSYGGTSPWTVLTDAGEQNQDFRMGDFDGNGRADLLYTKFKVISSGFGGSIKQYRADMYVKFNGTGSWKQINNDFHLTSNTDFAKNFRLGNFNSDKITDVFRFHDNKFRVYWGGRGDIKDLATVGPIRTEDLLFVDNLTIGGRTDIIHIDPVTKKWTVYNSGQPGTLPLTIKHSDKNIVVFADLDADPAQEPIALEMVTGDPASTNFPMARKVEIQPSTRASYVPGSLKKVINAGKPQLTINHELSYFKGRTTNRSRPPGNGTIMSVKELSTSKDISFRKLDISVTPVEGMKKVAAVENIELNAGKPKMYKVQYEGVESKTIGIPAYGISGVISSYKAVPGGNGNWNAWKAYLSKVAKPGKDLMLQQPLTTPKMISSINVEVAPFYTCVEEDEATFIEMDDVAKELNDIAYGNNAAKRTELFNGNQVFDISWTYELKNMSTGQLLPVNNPSSIAKNGKWKNSNVQYTFPSSTDLLQLTAKATIKDIYGHSQPKPVEFIFWNQQLETDGTPAQLNNWLNQFLGGRPGFVWVKDHWERVRAGQANQPQQLQITLAYLAEDKILTVRELEQVVK